MENKDVYTRNEVIEMMKAYHEVEEARVQHACLCPGPNDPAKREELAKKILHELIPKYMEKTPDNIIKEVFDMKCLEDSLK